jgi:hypothetical protein
VGYLDVCPEQRTQGKDIKELEEMLLDLYENFQEEAKQKKERIKKTGVLRVPHETEQSSKFPAIRRSKKI